MSDIANKLICLNLNRNWQPVNYKTVKDAIIDLCGSDASGKPSCLALNIDYELDDNGEPMFDSPKMPTTVTWSEWIHLPIRTWDLSINTPNRSIRVPTVIISNNYSKMPMKHFRGKPSKHAIFTRDRGICQYTGKKVDRESATIDHIIPKSKGGGDTWTNLVLCSRDINSKKGNKLNNEVGLRLLKNPTVPSPIPMSALIREAKHPDWKQFMTV